ncbi:MAG: endolytic transglycosylase MltG [Oscillospiraceae bacterium]|nr:endolytic transglycosylase MltG [Oscillospiraceae bacterium]
MANSDKKSSIDDLFDETAADDAERVTPHRSSETHPAKKRSDSGEHSGKKRSGSHSGKKGTAKKKKRKHRSARIYGVLIMLTIIFVTSISLAIGIIEVGKDMLGIDGTQTLVIFNIQEGETTSEIAANLKEAGIIRIPKAFVYFTRLSNDDANFIAGDHQVSSAMAYETIISELTGTAIGEDKEVVDVMFPEGITLNEAAKKLEEANVCEAARFLYYFNAGDQGYPFEEHLKGMNTKLKFNRMEGYLFPDTYTFYEEMEPDDVIRKIYVNFNAKMKPEYYDRIEELGTDLDKIITLASMIQAEASNEEDMKDISSVFWNRLNAPDQFRKLQSDPTSKYVENTIKPNIELDNPSIYDAYDTYICNGLPAGAICNPGTAAIEAALYPNETSYYYFYANVDTGVTYFARTLEEHNENIRKVKIQRGEEVPEEEEGEEGEDGEGEDGGEDE